MIGWLGPLLLASSPSGSVRADTVEVDLTTGRVSASGDVVAEVDGVHVHAEEVVYAEGRLHVRRGRVEPCACGEATYSVSAARATATSTGVSAVWPVLRVGTVPVLPLPYLYVPAAGRRTGLLTPGVRFTDPLGVQVRQPVYVTLGRSHDATLAPSLATSRGPGLEGQLRGRPSGRAGYEVGGKALWDFGAFDPDGRVRWGSGPAHVRWNTGGQADAVWRDGSMGARVDLVGDLAWRLDAASTWSARQAEWTRSRGAVGLKTGPVRWVVAAGYNQDLRPQTYSTVPLDAAAGRQISPFSNSAPVRAAEVQALLPPVPLVLSTWTDADLRLDLYSTGQVRSDLRPAWAGAWSFRGFGLQGEVAGRLTGWAGQVQGARIAPILSTRFGWEGARLWGRWHHRMAPAVRAVWIPTVANGGQPLSIPDEVQRLGPVSQVRLEFDTDWRRAGHVVALRTEWGWDFGQAGVPGLGASPWALQVDGRIPAGAWTLGASAFAAIEFETEPIRQARARLSASTARLRLETRYGHTASGLSGLSLKGPEALVPSANETRIGYVDFDTFYGATDPANTVPLGRLDGLQFAASVRPIVSWQIGAEVGLSFDPAERLETAYGIDGSVPVRDAAFRSDWTGACGCWGVGAWIRWARDRELPSVGASVRFEGLGSGEAFDGGGDRVESPSAIRLRRGS